MINIIAEKITKRNYWWHNNSTIFSIIIDTKQDISKADQMSQIFWYVKVNTNSSRHPSNFEIKESFLRLHEISDQNAIGSKNETVNSMEENWFNLNKSHGEVYDVAAVCIQKSMLE